MSGVSRVDGVVQRDPQKLDKRADLLAKVCVSSFMVGFFMFALTATCGLFAGVGGIYLHVVEAMGCASGLGFVGSAISGVMMYITDKKLKAQQESNGSALSNVVKG